MATTSKKLNGTTTPVAEAVQEQSTEQVLMDRLHSDITQLFGHMNDFMPQGTVIRFVARLVLYACGAVAATYVTMMLSGILLAAGWPVFIVAVLEIVGVMCACISSWMLSDTVVNYVADGKLTRDIKRVGQWFKIKAGNTSSFVKSKMVN